MFLSFSVFADNQTEDNQTTVERLVEENCPSYPTPVVNKKKKAKKLVLSGPTIQDSEEDNTNSTSNQMEVDSEVELLSQKGKEREKSTQESSISRMKVPDMPMISEPNLELSMSNLNRNKLHSEGSNTHLYDPVQAVLHGVQG
ncbi:hypothetical protein O181_074088 [Austropuccinia psidii MF-1]|uniref:Uncharacterized protein n=1 Tax=Austropuccinia psidii MF-1 TaxID=1389203 RepID=A0A9Q3FAD4_9BASI|nr:hypothetical protein [Austropuccinia psidii MF-1]